ncbi:uncharacterized protein MELLADRAFT_89545 [Melampsora larici-populina 98AG31]|uniref:Uncharacterized protein n=1 Tax=Melampsora larici-populina (strain 98AG31 / pathotype 3-4-7) TaxID=747676 RepID=F4RTR2_MELLP|nr:uncharacterized protein MELLADRAFT_89545 [Melampsora larici-populina 98AG31]EGG04219.1 hypothetical protein MELLADRAFT_89545 [Melampsora larici-populina 98AG31]
METLYLNYKTGLQFGNLGSSGQTSSSSSKKLNPWNIGLPEGFGNLGNILGDLLPSGFSLGNGKPSIQTWSTTETNINGKKNVTNHHYDSNNPEGNIEDLNSSAGNSGLDQNKPLTTNHNQTQDTTSKTPSGYGPGGDVTSGSTNDENIGFNLGGGGASSTTGYTGDQSGGSQNSGSGGGGSSADGSTSDHNDGLDHKSGGGGGGPDLSNKNNEIDQNSGGGGSGGSPSGYQNDQNTGSGEGAGQSGNSTTDSSNGGNEEDELQGEDCSEEQE